MLFAYTIFYVSDVAASLAFYQAAFGCETKFTTPDGTYAELATGGTTLAFASHELAESNFSEEYVRGTYDSKPLGVEIGFTTTEVEAAYQRAINNGATAMAAPVLKPWGQTVAYVKDNNGFIVELCSPMG